MWALTGVMMLASAGVEVPIIRPNADYPRIFVQAIMPDGKPSLFMVDTGADISVISERLADRLELDVDRNYATLSGLSGTVAMHRATLSSIGFGQGHGVSEVEVAVGIPGMSDEVGFIELDGLLGNNVWGHFAMAIDYPNNVITLSKDAFKAPKKAKPLFFDSGHLSTEIVVTTTSIPPVSDYIIAQVDTGASSLSLCGATGAPLQDAYTEGLEAIRGIGASETMPPVRYLQTTRRLSLKSVELGNQKIDPPALSARWLDFESPETATCDSGMRALLGQDYLSNHKVYFDYLGRKFWMERGKKKQPIDGHQIILNQQLKALPSPTPEQELYLAKLSLGASDLEADAEERLVKIVKARNEQSAEATVLLSNLLRSQGKHLKAWEQIHTLTAGELVDQDTIVGVVNGLLFSDQLEQASRLAHEAVQERSEEGWSHVALSDLAFYNKEIELASDSLLTAASLEHYPDAHLLRRARVALAKGDRIAAMAHLRRLLQLYPFGGHVIWFYAMLVEGDEEARTFVADLDYAMSRLHPDQRPIDFLVAAHRILGNNDQVQKLLPHGLKLHCSQVEGASRNNCEAWYAALAGVDLKNALHKVNDALEETGPRPDFLDTKAMVHLARGELKQAKLAARHAAQLSPTDVYMIWQAERIESMSETP